MKTIKVITAVVLFTGFTSLSFAGPGIDYSTRMAQIQKDKATVSAKALPAVQVAACTTCGCGVKKA